MADARREGRMGALTVGYTTEIPETTMADLRAYLEYGREPSGFLRTLLEGHNAVTVIGHADEFNTIAIKPICMWIYNVLPIEAWGSVGRVDRWIERKGRLGDLK